MNEYPIPMDPMSDEYMDLIMDTTLSGKRITCKECGKSHTLNWNGAKNKQLFDNKLCSDCFFWVTKINWDPQNVVRVNHEHFHISDPDPGFFGGHGGRAFRIYFNDGRIVESRNLWSQGTIPERFWDRLPDNATMTSASEEKAQLAPSIPEVPATGIETLKDYLQVHHEASQYINWSLPIKVCHSGAGYYVGMWDDEGPVARFSEYWATQEEAQSHLDNLDFELRLWA